MELTSSYSRVAINRDVSSEAMSKFDADLPFDNLFGENITRLVIPFEDEMKQEINKKVGKLGYDFIDWNTGEVLKTILPHEKAPPGTLAKVQRTKLGRVLERLPDGENLLNWWSANKEVVKDTEYSIVISRHPIDVVRMSDHEDISSCHSPDGEEWHSCMNEMKHGGLVAYLIKTDDLKDLPPGKIPGQGEIFYDQDRNIDGIEPESRIRLRRFTHEDDDFDLALPEDRIYGGSNSSSEFKEQVNNWARKSQKTLIGNKRWRMDEFIRRGGQYTDTLDSILFNNFFDDALDRGNTQHGVAGEEDEDRNDQLRVEIEELHQRWQREFAHCSTSYEEYDPDEDELMFYWNGSMGVNFPENTVTAEALVELTDEDLLNRGDSSLKSYLTGKYFYVGAGGAHFSHYQGTIHFYFDVSDSDNNSGGPGEYDDFCDSVYDNWDAKHDEIKSRVMMWLLDNELSPPTPVRQFEYSDIQFKNFEVEIGDGEMQASAEAEIGETEPELWDKEAFKNYVDTPIRNLVSRELTRIIYNRKHPTGYLPGFEPEQPITVKEDYNLSNFGLFITTRYSGHIELEIKFLADDLTTEADMQEVIELMQVVDRLFPRIIVEAGRLLEDYYNKIREVKRQGYAREEQIGETQMAEE